jgi:hypothetical protein
LAALIALTAVLMPLRARAQTETPTRTPRPTRTPPPPPTQTPVIIVVTPTAEAEAESTPEVTPTPEFSAARPAINGGTTVVTKESDSFGLSGETVDAGTFEVHNRTNVIATITEVVIDATDQQVVSSFSLTGRGGRDQQTVSVTPAGDNWFLFEPGLTIEPGEAASFSLSATIAATTVDGTATPEAADTSTPTPTPTELIFGERRDGLPAMIAASVLPVRPSAFPFGVLVFGLVVVGVASAARGDRRGVLATLSLLALVGVVWLGGLTGCAGEQTTNQTVVRVSGRTRTNPVRFTGVPVSIGRVSRPQPLLFPGHVDSLVGTATPSF